MKKMKNEGKKEKQMKTQKSIEKFNNSGKNYPHNHTKLKIAI
jgi:hypothetical protein